MFKMKAIRATVAAALLGATGAASAAVITLDFEGVGNSASVNNFYNGGTDSLGNSGTNYGVAFNSNALGLIDEDVGGYGNFGNEPTPDTVLFFKTGSAILNYAPGFTTGFSFFYTTVNFRGTVSVYDDVNATGNLIGTISLAPLGAGPGDPTGDYSNWATGSLGFSGTAKSIDFGVVSLVNLTDKPVKGMLTGPVTILCWSFPREDVSREQSALQIGLAIRDEVADLEAAGIKIIQIDEPAIREGLPLRKQDHQAYLDWAVRAFRLSASPVVDSTQIHTHMCYSDFNLIIEAVAALDADVITIETSRSQMQLLEAFERFNYPNEIGPGVYDIHSPNVPSQGWIEDLIRKAAQQIPADRLWVNPDCGLKTRGWEETTAALKVMVDATRALRAELA